jgi:hypothetical protein
MAWWKPAQASAEPLSKRASRGNERAEGAHPDRDPRMPEGVVDACGESALLRWRRAECDGAHGRVEQAGADPGEQQARQ